jgi:hypothetical protein
MEADTVAHCDNSLAGDFVWSLTMTDIHTGWTECRAVWNKAANGVVAQVHDIERNLPYATPGRSAPYAFYQPPNKIFLAFPPAIIYI